MYSCRLCLRNASCLKYKIMLSYFIFLIAAARECNSLLIKCWCSTIHPFRNVSLINVLVCNRLYYCCKWPCYDCWCIAESVDLFHLLLQSCNVWYLLISWELRSSEISALLLPMLMPGFALAQDLYHETLDNSWVGTTVFCGKIWTFSMPSNKFHGSPQQHGWNSVA